MTTGFTDVRTKGAELGFHFDPWQDGAGQIALGKRADGKYAATVGGVVISIPRQVGKTFLVGALLMVMCVLFPGLKVIWTAHRIRTSTNTFRSMQGYARRRRVAPHIAQVRMGAGDQEIRFTNGSMIIFGAREQGFGRGFDEVDMIVFDEAQILTEKALDDMIATANQSRHPHGALLFYMGTPPRPIDPGEVFTNKRNRALAGEADDMAYIEFSADPDADPDDQEQWRVANPSYPHRTPKEAMLRMRANLLSDESFLREGLGIWDANKGSGVIPGPSWKAQRDQTSKAVDRLTLGVECGPDLAFASIALAGQREDGDWHFELDEDQHTKGRGAAWLVPHLEKTLRLNPDIRAVVVDVAGPVKAMLEQFQPNRWRFKHTSIEVTPVKVAELGTGCTQVLDGIVTGWLWHIDQPQFTAAALPAGKRPLGDTGMWVWSRKLAESDITPIQAGTLALIGAQLAKVRKPIRSRGGGRVLIPQ